MSKNLRRGHYELAAEGPAARRLAVAFDEVAAAASGSVPASMAGVRVRPHRLVLVGSVVVDVLLYVDRLPDRGGDLLARQAVAGAGGGFNVLVAAARLGLEAAYGGRTGTGVFGARARRALEQAGIAALLPSDERADTGLVVGLVEPDGERTFVTAPGTESRLAPRDLRALPLRAGDAVYVSGYDLVYPVSGQSLEGWLPGLADDLLVAIDPGPTSMRRWSRAGGMEATRRPDLRQHADLFSVARTDRTSAAWGSANSREESAVRIDTRELRRGRRG